MATRAKKSRGKAGGTTGSKRGKPAARAGGAKSAKKSSAKRPATKSAAKKSAGKKSPPKPTIRKVHAARPALKTVAKKVSAMKKTATGKKVAAAKKTATRSTNSAIARVTRVAKEVAHQATAAMSEGVDSIKEFSEGIVERVTG